MRSNFRPSLSYFFAGVLPWLMLATAFRIIHLTDPNAIPSFVIAHLAIFIAFLVAAQRMIEIADGRTNLGSWSFVTQIRIGIRIIWRIALLVFAAGFLAALLGDSYLALEIFYGFDGIAFDGTGVRKKAVSGLLAALILLLVLQIDRGDVPSLIGAGREFLVRIKHLGPAVIAVMIFLILLSGVQGVVRRPMFEFWAEAPLNLYFRTIVYFAFVAAFAAFRLCVVLAVLTFALRQSYRRRAYAS